MVDHMGEILFAQKNAQRRHRGMYRVQQRGNLHPLRLVHSFPVTQINTLALFQRRTAVGEPVLDNQILGILSVDKWSDISTPGGFNWLHILHTQRFQIRGNIGIGPGGDFVDHGPGKSDDRFIRHISGKSFVHIPFFLPFLCHCQNRAAQQTSVLRTVVHGNQRQRSLPVTVPLQQHGGQHTHGAGDFVRAVVDIRLYKGEILSGSIGQRVALLRDSKGYQLQRGGCENLLQPVPLLRIIRLRANRLAKASQHLIISFSGLTENDAESQVVIGAVDFVHHIVIKGFHAGKRRIQIFAFQHPVGNSPDENTENISDSEMRPARCLFGLFGGRVHIVAGQRYACVIPFCFFSDSVS